MPYQLFDVERAVVPDRIEEPARESTAVPAVIAEVTEPVVMRSTDERAPVEPLIIPAADHLVESVAVVSRVRWRRRAVKTARLDDAAAAAAAVVEVEPELDAVAEVIEVAPVDEIADLAAESVEIAPVEEVVEPAAASVVESVAVVSRVRWRRRAVKAARLDDAAAVVEVESELDAVAEAVEVVPVDEVEDRAPEPVVELIVVAVVESAPVVPGDRRAVKAGPRAVALASFVDLLEARASAWTVAYPVPDLEAAPVVSGGRRRRRAVKVVRPDDTNAVVEVERVTDAVEVAPVEVAPVDVAPVDVAPVDVAPVEVAAVDAAATPVDEVADREPEPDVESPAVAPKGWWRRSTKAVRYIDAALVSFVDEAEGDTPASAAVAEPVIEPAAVEQVDQVVDLAPGHVVDADVEPAPVVSVGRRRRRAAKAARRDEPSVVVAETELELVAEAVAVARVDRVDQVVDRVVEPPIDSSTVAPRSRRRRRGTAKAARDVDAALAHVEVERVLDLVAASAEFAPADPALDLVEGAEAETELDVATTTFELVPVADIHEPVANPAPVATSWQKPNTAWIDRVFNNPRRNT